MILKCIVVDDQPQDLQTIKNYIKKISFLELTGTYADSKTALLSMKNNGADLVFLQIQKIRQDDPSFIATFQLTSMVILISSNKNLCFYGFEYGVIDFLTKPVLPERFYKAAERAYKTRFTQVGNTLLPETAPLKGGYIFIKESTRYVRVELDDIYFVTGLKNYVSIQTKSHRLVSLQTMKQMEELLPARRFIRVHRSYFVALDKIISVEKQQIQIKDKSIPIGNIYLPLFMKRLTRPINQ